LIGIVGFGLCTTTAAVLHMIAIDDRLSAENTAWILAMFVFAAWYFPKRLLIIQAIIVQSLWSFGDGIHGSNGLICLLGGMTRIAICTVVIFGIARARERLTLAEQFARADSLTGLPNRRAIVETLDSELCRTVRSGRPFSLALLDCDGFKAINDGQGHLVGDRVLQMIATGLKKQIRPYDCIGRFGGDEFVIILSDTGESEVAPIIARIRNTLKQELQAEFASLSFSIGIVTVTLASTSHQRPQVTWEECVRQADAAMYAAKRSGRDQDQVLSLEI